MDTECGRRLIDFSCGIGVTNLGHCHAGVTDAVLAAVPNLVHAQQNIIKHRPMIDLINKLSDLPFARKSKLDHWFFWNSGAEAGKQFIYLNLIRIET